MDSSEQICAAATRLFAAQGFDGTSLQSIADQVGVAKQTLLYHYPSKDSLRQKVLASLLEHWRKRLPQMLKAVTSGHHRFDALTEELVRFFRDDPDRARLLAREMLDNPEGMAKLLSNSLRPWLLLVAQYIYEGQESGVVYEDMDPEAYVMNTIVSVIAIVASEAVISEVLGASATAKSEQPRSLAELVRSSRRALFHPPRGDKRAEAR